MKKGIRGHDVEEIGLENICKKCIKQGISYIQLVLEKSIEGFTFGSFSQEYASMIKNQLGDINIAVLGSYINPSNPDDDALKSEIEKFKEKIKYASILNPIAVGTETGKYIDGLTNSEEAYQRVLKTMRALVPEAEKHGVSIGIEGVSVYVINTPQRMKRLVDDLDSSSVKVIFDPVNYINIDNYQKQDEMIGEMFDLLADKICAIHLKDFVVEDNKIKPVSITEGILNYKLILQKVKEYGIDVPLISEGYTDSEAVVAFEKLNEILIG